MKSIGERAREMRVLETLATGDTVIHRLHPAVKLITSIFYICIVASFGRYEFVPLAPYLFYPFVIAALAELPHRVLLKRMLAALPFCLFAGLSNVFFDRAVAFTVYGFAVSFGVVSFFAIMLKMYLCVMAALLLISTTPLTELTSALRLLRVPYVFVTVFEMTYRYVAVLLDEAHSMSTAYALRGNGKRALELRHMGSFAGQLLLRGFDRANRVYAAMLCRGYNRRGLARGFRAVGLTDAAFAVFVCGASVLLRFVRIF